MAVKRLRLAARRRATGYSQEQLAEHLGVERSTVTRWEAGETAPQPWFRPRIAGALRISLDGLDELLAAAAAPVEPVERDLVVTAPWSHRGTLTASVALSGGGGLVERRTFLFLAGQP